MIKIIKNYRLSLIFCMVVMLPLTGCTGRKSGSQPVGTAAMPAAKSSVTISSETALLLKDLEGSGDYVKGKLFPSLIKASIVKESLDKNILVVDLRPSAEFSTGHIKGAVNKRFEELPSYLETGIKPFEFDKIILVCADGQVSSYTTCLLRLMGYGNVYAMRWGMSAWNEKYAKQGWLSGVSGKFEGNLDKTTHERPAPGNMPELNTGKVTGAEVSAARFARLFSDGTRNILISADEVFADPSRYFIINLDRKDKYDDGHIPGAVRYKPEATLGFPEEMASIPTDKTVVVYCGTGHNSGFATAFLRLFGYDARTLKYGNNSFMFDKMVSQKTALSWVPFSTSDVNNFEVVR
jgi:rhodanese-related sulfurtransferase